MNPQSSNAPMPNQRRQIANLREALVESVTPIDIQQIVGRLIELAKNGNIQAARLVLSYAIGKPQSAPKPESNDDQPAPVMPQPVASAPLTNDAVVNPVEAPTQREVVQTADLTASETKEKTAATYLRAAPAPPLSFAVLKPPRLSEWQKRINPLCSHSRFLASGELDSLGGNGVTIEANTRKGCRSWRMDARGEY